MTEYDLSIHDINCEKYGPLPAPVRFRDGPKGADGKALDPARKRIAVYPDGTFPIKQIQPHEPQ